MITIIFRTLAILGGVLMGFFAYQIFRYSKGGLRGWMYLSCFGFSLFFWATTALITKIIGVTLLERITGILGLAGMAFFLPLAYSKLTDELNLKKPKFLNGTFSVAFSSLVFLILIAMNIIKPTFMEYPLDKLLSISHFGLGVCVLFAIFPLYFLIVNIKKKPWVIAMIATIILAMSLFVGQHYDGCCGKNGELQDNEELCGNYDLPYVQVSDMPCYAPIVSFGEFYQAYLTIGVLTLTLSYFQLARFFRKMTE